jgi:hypothetical protein
MRTEFCNGETKLKNHLTAIFLSSMAVFVLASLLELKLHRKEGKFIKVTPTHFLVLSWAIPEVRMLTSL